MGLLDTRNQIISKLEKGQSREEVFNEHVANHPAEAARFAYAIASVPHQHLRQKYLRLNGVLFLMLLGIAVLAVMAELPINFEESTLFIVIKTSVPLIFSYFVYHFHGGIYRLLGCWCLFDLFELVFLVKFTALAGIFKLLLLFLAACLAFIIALKVFPNLGFLGPKKNKQGAFLL